VRSQGKGCARDTLRGGKGGKTCGSQSGLHGVCAAELAREPNLKIADVIKVDEGPQGDSHKGG